ncbi:MAG: hypothetical protein JXC36_05860 [Candidatus Atribacteria bacterium]|nr:hypothetical protein [Candidatus Atribacteria bacterium]
MKLITLSVSLLMIFSNIKINAQDNWVHLTKKEGLASTWVRDCVEDEQGNMWFTTDKGLCKYDGEIIESFTKKEDLPIETLMKLFIDKNGIIWFTIEPANSFSDILAGGVVGDMLAELTKRGNGWGRYDGNKITAFMNKASSEYLMSQMENIDGEIWIAGVNQKNEEGYFLVDYDGQTFDPLTQLGGVDLPFVNYFYSEGKNDIWFSSWAENEDYIYHFDGANLTVYGEKDGLPSKANRKFINKIVKGSNGHLWFGSSYADRYGGLLKFDGTNWTVYTEDDGVTGKSINQIVEDKDGNIWVATNKGLNVFDGSTWKNYYDKLPGKIINTIVSDSQGRVWIGTEKGLVLYTDENWSIIDKKSGLTNNNVNIIYEDRNGNIWLGAGFSWKIGGVSVFNGETWNALDLSKFYTVKFFEDSKNNMWLLSIGNGVVKIEGGY